MRKKNDYYKIMGRLGFRDLETFDLAMLAHLVTSYLSSYPDFISQILSRCRQVDDFFEFKHFLKMPMFRIVSPYCSNIYFILVMIFNLSH